MDESYSVDAGETEQQDTDPLQMLARFIELPNIADELDDETINQISMTCRRGYEADLASISAERERFEELSELATMAMKEKTYPFIGASNVNYPMVIDAALQFNARSYPIVINNGRVVRIAVTGNDEGGQKTMRSERVGKHMSWQLMEQMDEWDSGMDYLLLALPIVGCVFKKVWRDDSLGRNSSRVVRALDLVVNRDTTDLQTCPRISHVISFYPYEIRQNVNFGIWREANIAITDEDNQEPEEFIEQHCLYDLDGDDYPEPYIVTYHKETGEVVRVVANYGQDDVIVGDHGVVKITPSKYFVKYECFPDPTGGFYGIGIGHLIKPINDSVNSILNQMIDAGHLANAGGGFLGKGFRIRSGDFERQPGEWTKVEVLGEDLAKNVYPLPVPQPSPVLFTLLGMLVDSAKSIASIQDVMTGDGGQNMPATSVLALIEQGMKVYTAIFKRIYRSMKQEMAMLYDLNSQYLTDEEYQTVLDDPNAQLQDYEGQSKDIRPEADPNMATDMQKMAKSEYMRSFIGMPGVNPQEIIKYAWEAANIDNPERFFIKDEGPSPEQLEALAELQLKEREQSRKERETLMKNLKSVSDMLKNVAETDEKGANNSINMAEVTLLYNEATEILKEMSNDEPR